MLRNSIRFVRSDTLVTAVAILSLAAAALALRLAGIAFDRPYLYYPDETAIVVPAMTMVAHKSVNPQVFTYPSLVPYLEGIIVGVVHALGGASLAVGMDPSYGTLPGISSSNLEPAQYPYVLWGRRLVALIGVLGVLLVVAAGRLAIRRATAGRTDSPSTKPDERATSDGQAPGPDRGWLAGIAAGAFLALAVLPLDYSRYLTSDVPTGTASAAAMLACVAAAVRGPGRSGNRLLILSGFLVGVAASTKYTAAALAVVPAIVYLTRAGSLRALPGWLARAARSRLPYAVALAAVFGFVLCTPMIVVHTGNVIHDAMVEVFHYNVEGHPGVEGSSGAYYLDYLWTTGFGPVLSVLAVAGIGWALFRHRAVDLVLVAFPLIFFALVSIPKVHFERNLMPMIPFVALLAGRFVADLAAAVASRADRLRPHLGPLAAALLLAMLVAQPAWAAVDDARQAELPRTETAALEWVNAHIPAGSTVVREEYTPQVDPWRYKVGWIWSLSDHPLDWYRARGFHYAIVSTRLYGRFLSADFQAEDAFYKGALRLPHLVDVGPTADLSGPTITVLDLRTGP